MLSLLRRYSEQTYALLRIVAGFMFLFHGTQKLLGFPLESHGGPAYITYGAGLIEMVGGILICIGLFTRVVAFICSGAMAFAYWMAHGTESLLPLVNKGELAALYCFVFLCIAANGAGVWSVDAARRGALRLRTR